MMREMMLRQCEFVSGDTHTVGYVEDDKRVKVGVQVTLKNDLDEGQQKRWWTVTRVGQRIGRSSLNRGFHAGGL